MDYQSPPEIVVQLPAEHHNVAEEVIELVARLLCRADGCDPDGDMRCGTPDSHSFTVTCNAIALPYPEYLGWNKYREQAKTVVRNLFPVPVSQPDPCAPPSIYPMHCINPAVR